MAEEKTLVPFNLPALVDEEESANFITHSLALAQKLVEAINSYVDASAEVSASSIGAACYIASHVVAVNCADSRKDLILRGLLLTMAANSPNHEATPPTNLKVN